MDYPILPDSVPFGSHELAPTTGIGGLLTGGNVVSSLPATVVTAALLNMLILEQRNLVQASGLTPDVQNWTQLTQAVALIGTRLVVFLPGTQVWTAPPMVYRVYLRVAAAGGAGGGSSDLRFPGGGGGGGGVWLGYASVTPGTQYNVTVGRGAAAAVGGDSSFDTLITAKGGTAGTNGSSTTVGTGGSGGAALGSIVAQGVTRIGGPGTAGIASTSTLVEGGRGGAAHGGTIACTVGSTSVGFNGYPGQFPGGGSSGCTFSTVAGANGEIQLLY